MKKNYFIIIGLLISIVTFSQDLEVKSGEIKIPLNRKILISAENINGQLTDFKLLNQDKVDKPIDLMKTLDNIEKTECTSNEIEFKFCYADFMGSKIIVLTTIHHFKNSITFKAKIKLKGSDNYNKTSIVEKFPNVLSIEQWQDEIESIILYDFEIKKK